MSKETTDLILVYILVFSFPFWLFVYLPIRWFLYEPYNRKRMINPEFRIKQSLHEGWGVLQYNVEWKHWLWGWQRAKGSYFDYTGWYGTNGNFKSLRDAETAIEGTIRDNLEDVKQKQELEKRVKAQKPLDGKIFNFKTK
jgi:hypothetical protein